MTDFEMFADESWRPNPPKYRYHCELCGRFVPFATVHTDYNRWDGDRTNWGRCKTHGEVEVVWGEQ